MNDQPPPAEEVVDAGASTATVVAPEPPPAVPDGSHLRQPWRWLAGHFAAHARRAKWPFLWRITLEGLAVSIGVALLLAAFGLVGERAALKKLSPGMLFFYACVVAPVFETLLLQSLPVTIARAMRARFWIQVFASTVLFAAAHLAEGFGTAVSAGLFGGFYFAFTYVRWREESFGTAFAMTAITHAARNAMAVSALVMR